MSYQDKIREVIKNMHLGTAEFKVDVYDKRIALIEYEWDHGLDTHNFIGFLVASYGDRAYDLTFRRYTMDADNVIGRSEKYIMGNIIGVFKACSPYNQPKRTKVYKDFCDVVRNNRRDEEFKKSIFDIHEYYFNSTLTDSIKHRNNDVHRTNVYQLLCLMEKSYGKKTSN